MGKTVTSAPRFELLQQMKTHPFWGFVLPLCALITFLTYCVSWLFYGLHHGNGDISLFTLWSGWDGKRYLDIIQNGYANEIPAREQLAFFPLYPFLASVLDRIVHHSELSALVVSNTAYLLASWWLYQLVELDYGEKVAKRAVYFLAIFPTAYILHAIYTESLFIALSVGAVLHFRRKQMLRANLLIFLVATARIHGLLLLPLVFGEWITAPRAEKKWADLFFPALSASLGLGVYLLVNYAVEGDPLYFLYIQKVIWQRTVDTPWMGLKVALRSFHSADFERKVLVGFFEIAAAALGLIGVIFAFFQLRLGYFLFMLCGWLLVVCNSFWMSQPRHLLCLFPLFILFAKWIQSEAAVIAVTVTWVFLYILFLCQFVNWNWAF